MDFFICLTKRYHSSPCDKFLLILSYRYDNGEYEAPSMGCFFVKKKRSYDFPSYYIWYIEKLISFCLSFVSPP